IKAFRELSAYQMSITPYIAISVLSYSKRAIDFLADCTLSYTIAKRLFVSKLLSNQVSSCIYT
ncbi:hypothetical protein, partial [Prevotella aurantiaca]|uniref:hypothetical protein n=1 Tax=Prevotella aurantiaca TaxID=596085 RepID=UPI002355473A